MQPEVEWKSNSDRIESVAQMEGWVVAWHNERLHSSAQTRRLFRFIRATMKVNRKVDAAQSYSHIYSLEPSGTSPRSWLVAVTIRLFLQLLKWKSVLIFIFYIHGEFSFHFGFVFPSILPVVIPSVVILLNLSLVSVLSACPIVRANLFFFFSSVDCGVRALFDVDMRASVLCQI